MKKRGYTGRCLLPSRGDTTKAVCALLNWKVVIFAITLHGVSGVTNDNDYYSYDDYIEIDFEEEERIHELIVDRWYNLIRYLVGLSLCIFGLIGLYFHQYASYYFLKRYTRSSLTERRIGQVVLCEPLLSSTSIDGADRTKKKRKKKKVRVISVRTSGGDVAEDDSTNATSYVLEEDLESYRHPQEQYDSYDTELEQEATEYRMLVIYQVPRSGKSSILCCNGDEKSMVITCTNSFSVNSCVSGISDIYEDTDKVIKSYRNRIAPNEFNDNTTFQDFSGKLNSNMDYMTRNDEYDYFKWFETKSSLEVNTEVDLILLKGQPTSACTPELLESHLEQVGKAHMAEEDGCCKSIHLTGTGLILAVIVLSLVCYFEIEAMPNPEVQRPLGFTIFGGLFFGSILSAYLFARLLFEQYKKKVFLSAVHIPTQHGDIIKRAQSEASILTFPSTVARKMRRNRSEASRLSKASIDSDNVSSEGSAR